MSRQKLCLITDSDGSTLIENVVALALLLSVILPVGAFLGDLTLIRPAALRSEALALARSEMERVLDSEPETRSIASSEGRFTVHTESRARGAALIVSVRVYRDGSDHTLVHLCTLWRPV